MTIQNYERVYGYIHEYQKLVFDYYSKHAVAFLVTYYNIEPTDTVWDDVNLMGGSYEQVGDLSGIRRNKILLLPVYFSDEITVGFEGEDTGLHKLPNETSFVIPSSYKIRPYVNDIVKLEQEFMQPNNDTYPLYQVTGIEIHPNTERRFWKLRCKVFQNRNLDTVEAQVVNTYSFVEYTKQIQTLEDAQFISKLLYKHDLLRKRLNEKLFDNRVGFYYPMRDPTTC